MISLLTQSLFDIANFQGLAKTSSGRSKMEVGSCVAAWTVVSAPNLKGLAQLCWTAIHFSCSTEVCFLVSNSETFM